MTNKEFFRLYSRVGWKKLEQCGNTDIFSHDELFAIADCTDPFDIADALPLLYQAMVKGNRNAANFCLAAAIQGHNIYDLDIFQIAKLAGDTGEPESAYNLAMMYGLTSNDDTERIKNALHYYRISAEGDNVNAMSRLAIFYANGIGVEKSLDIAAYWAIVKPLNKEIQDAGTVKELFDTASKLIKVLDYINVKDVGFFTNLGAEF